MANKNRRTGRVEDPAQQHSSGPLPSPRPGKRTQHLPQIPLPFAPDSGSVIVSEREQLHALLSSLPVVLFVVDRQANLTMLEGKGVTLLARSRQTAVGSPFFELYPQNTETRRLLATAFAGTAVSWTEHRGDHLFVTTLTPLRDRDDSVTGLLGIGIETSGMVPTAGSSETAPHPLPGAPSLNNQYFAQVSHELRTPLNSIAGFANLLLKNRELHFNEQDLFYIQRIAGNATHLLGVVGEMMDLSVVETGRMKIAVSAVDLAGLIRETFAEIGIGSVSGSVELRTEIPADARPIETDRQKLKQVLINLLSNALKFTLQGSVTVSVAIDEFQRPIRIDVRDTGIGIPAENLEVIFEAYNRGEQAAGQDFEGTGLGLTISRALCRLLGYTIRAVSDPGKGSTFSIDCSRTPASQPR